MLKLKASSLKPGLKLGKDLYTYDGRLLLPKNSVITLKHLQAFESRNINEVFIMGVPPQLKSAARFTDVYMKSLQAVKSFMLGAKLGRQLDSKEINDTVEMLLKQVFNEINLFKQMQRIQMKDEYLFTHSVNVSLLCILIGRWLNLDDKVIRDLGVAGLLHDIGKVFIPNDILNKPGKLTEQEFAEMKKHTLLGYKLLVKDKVVLSNVSNAVLMHHERLDGSGYPLGVKGTGIGHYAGVVAVADIYDAITSDRVYSHKKSPYAAVEILWRESFGKLDACISKVFYDKITDFFIGNEVVLSNQEKGVVVYINPTRPTRPVVMAGEKFYDLSLDPNLSIVEVIA